MKFLILLGLLLIGSGCDMRRYPDETNEQSTKIHKDGHTYIHTNSIKHYKGNCSKCIDNE